MSSLPIQIIVLLYLFGDAVNAGLIPAAPVIGVAPIDPHPHYSFAYDVKDTLTGDFKSHVESRHGNIVSGRYTVLDPDGTKRIVHYTADPVNGFNAVVSRAPIGTLATAPVVAKLAPSPALSPVVPAFPAVAKLAPPLYTTAVVG